MWPYRMKCIHRTCPEHYMQIIILYVCCVLYISYSHTNTGVDLEQYSKDQLTRTNASHNSHSLLHLRGENFGHRMSSGSHLTGLAKSNIFVYVYIYIHVFRTMCIRISHTSSLCTWFDMVVINHPYNIAPILFSKKLCSDNIFQQGGLRVAAQRNENLKV